MDDTERFLRCRERINFDKMTDVKHNVHQTHMTLRQLHEFCSEFQVSPPWWVRDLYINSSLCNVETSLSQRSFGSGCDEDGGK
jgi:hypothetical protein